MCGRFSLGSTTEAISSFFKGLTIPLPLVPRYNIAPSQEVLAIRSEYEPVMLRWGLIPRWAKDFSIGYKMINARAETVAEKPSFKSAYHSRRCLIPADGFYEWKKEGAHKQPYHIRKTDRELFCFAGLWEEWACKSTGELIESCTIITTEANSLLKPIHHRMPAVILPEAFDRWLASDSVDELIQPYEWERFEAVPVSTFVNNASNQGFACIERINS